MGIISFFIEEMNRTISVFPKLDALVGGRPSEGFETVATASGVKAAIYEGGAAEALVSDRYKTNLAAVAVIYPGTSVPDGAKVTTDDSRTFYCIHADDVMTQGDVLVIALQSNV